MPNKATRRTVLGSIAGLTVGLGVTKIPRATEGSQVAFEITDISHEGTDEITDVHLGVEVTLDWDSEFTPDGYEVRLDVGQNGDSVDLLDFSIRSETLPADGSDTVLLSGNLTETDYFAVEDFQIQDGTIELFAELQFSLRKDGENTETIRRTDTATIQIEQTELGADLSVVATGELEILTE